MGNDIPESFSSIPELEPGPKGYPQLLPILHSMERLDVTAEHFSILAALLRIGAFAISTFRKCLTQIGFYPMVRLLF